MLCVAPSSQIVRARRSDAEPRRRRGVHVRVGAVLRALTLVATVAGATAALPATAGAERVASPEVGTTDATDRIDPGDRLVAPIACPLLGPSEFIDSWGDQRSGGRRHQGVDMIADRGVPIVAAETGDAHFKRSGLGGNAIWLTTSAGDRYYYAHLDGFHGESRSVVRGEVIGYVGSTGNAGGPHLHFERHLDGSATNPFGAVFAACVRPADVVLLAGARAPGADAGTTTGTDSVVPLDLPVR